MTKFLLIFALVSIGCGNDPTGPSNEVIEWRKTLGEGWGNSVLQTVDGGFVVTGIDGDYGRYGVLLFKTNELGYSDDLVDE